MKTLVYWLKVLIIYWKSFLCMLLDILGVGLLENLSVGKGACKDVTDAGNGANQ